MRDATEVRLVTFHNPHAANPLGRDVFGGPYDDQWDAWPDEERGVVLYGPVAHGVRAAQVFRGSL